MLFISYWSTIYGNTEKVFIFEYDEGFLLVKAKYAIIDSLQ